jgi:hypothetical protein
MAGADKRAQLLSDLLAAKGGASAAAGQSAEPERASVVQIAKRRLGEDRASEAPVAQNVLYNKGAATASTFRPSYWSFDHTEQAEPTAESASVEPAPPSPASAPAVAHTQSQTRKPLPVNFVIGFGCLALVVSTAFFVASFWHRGEVSTVRPEPVQTASASAPTPSVVPLPPHPQAEAATPALAAPVPAPVASDPPAPVVAAPAAEAAAEPTPAAAAAPAVSSNPQADALMARGDDLLATGDVSAARLFYQRAAEQGSAAAATAVGQTYDPAVLELLRVRGARGDAQIAAQWYRKAIAAGDRQAEIRLKRLLARTSG